MLKHIKIFALALCTTLFFAACSEDEPFQPGTSLADNTPPITNGVLVVNQGSQGYKLSGTLDLIDLDRKTRYPNTFESVNGRALGFTPQNAALNDSLIFVAVFDENLVQVINRQSFKATDTIRVAQPQSVLTDKDYLYISSNSGTVMQVNVRTKARKQVAVGPNPMGLVVSNGTLFVAISDAYNYQGANPYANGKKLVKLHPTSLEKQGEVAVGINPTQLATDGKGNVFVVCQGNYADVPSQVYKVDAQARTSVFAPGSFMAVMQGVVYVVHSQSDYSGWPEVKQVNSFTAYDAQTAEKVKNFDLKDAPTAPTAIVADAKANMLYITSDKKPGDYSAEGTVSLYAPDGTLHTRYDVGIHPVFALGIH